MASQKSKGRSRKRRNQGTAPRAASSQRRALRAERAAAIERAERRAHRQLGTEGQRPAGPFGGVPVSEIAIFAGLVAVVVWLVRGGTPVLVVGLVATTLGVLEVTGREHFSGYRSHTTLLAAIPAVALAIGVISLIGVNRSARAPLMIAIAGPVYALLFWQLRKRFMAARQARVARLPVPGARS